MNKKVRNLFQFKRVWMCCERNKEPPHFRQGRVAPVVYSDNVIYWERSRCEFPVYPYTYTFIRALQRSTTSHATSMHKVWSETKDLNTFRKEIWIILNIFEIFSRTHLQLPKWRQQPCTICLDGISFLTQSKLNCKPINLERKWDRNLWFLDRK